MSVVFYTSVLKSDPSPLGLLPESWHVWHVCSRCRERVSAEALVAHAQTHEDELESGDA